MKHRSTARPLSTLLRDRRGNVMMIMGFALLPLVFTAGMVIDYSRAARMQTKLNALTDAAALAATTTPMLDKPWQAACNAARNTFRNQLSNDDVPMKGVVFDNAKLKVVVVETYASKADVTRTCSTLDEILSLGEVLPLSRNVTVSYEADSTNIFGSILKSSNIAIGGESATRVAIPPYIDIHLALDTSQSMGLVANSTDEAKMFEETLKINNEGCTFGCHAKKSGHKKANDAIAADNKIKLRIDVLKEATVDMIDTAVTSQKNRSLYRFALYRIGASLTDIKTLSSNLADVKATASQLTLGENDSSGFGDTNLPDMTDKILPKITTKGNGTTAETARAFLFIVSDGVKDTKGSSCISGHCTSAIDPVSCKAYKDAGITVGVVYTTFSPIYNDPRVKDSGLQGDYSNLVKPFADQIAPKLQSCASPGWFFEATSATAIHSAMQKLFSQASQAPIITN